jgi:hypothetical protein
MTVDFKSTPLEPLALQARVVQWGWGVKPVFHMLQQAVPLADLGADHLDRLDEHRTTRRLVRRLDALGHAVMPRPRAAG